jgi:hypothetical protein
MLAVKLEVQVLEATPRTVRRKRDGSRAAARRSIRNLVPSSRAPIAYAFGSSLGVINPSERVPLPFLKMPA